MARPYISLHEGMDVGNKLRYGARHPTRSWPIDHWAELVRRLQAARPDLPIVQVGTRRATEPVPGVDHMLLDEASFLESAAIISRSVLHLDSETGMVCIAWAFNRPTISLQGPSASEYYQIGRTHSYYWNACNGCWWLHEDWMSRCARGLPEAACMRAIAPAFIAEEAMKLLAAGAATP